MNNDQSPREREKPETPPPFPTDRREKGEDSRPNIIKPGNTRNTKK